jgi:hypothetical protein
MLLEICEPPVRWFVQQLYERVLLGSTSPTEKFRRVKTVPPRRLSGDRRELSGRTSR